MKTLLATAFAVLFSTTLMVPNADAAKKTQAPKKQKTSTRTTKPKARPTRQRQPRLVLNYDLAGNPFYHTERVLSMH